MRRLTTFTGTILLLVVALSPAGLVAGRAPEGSTPLLEAMAYIDPASDPLSVEFVDRAQLKALYEGASITSASPLEDRQRLLLDMARNESLPFGLGLDRLNTMADEWGWDTTDLEWQASYMSVPGVDGKQVLRFGGHWNARTFREALERLGYERDDSGGGEVWLPPREAIPVELHLERIDGQERTGPDPWETYAGVAIDSDRRTIVVHEFARSIPLRQLLHASRPHPDRVAGLPAVRAAAALERPLTADVQASSGASLFFCTLPEEAGYLEDDPETRATVDELQRYEARANGYTRRDRDSAPLGRHVFAYGDGRSARLDLEARSALAVAGPRGTVVSLVDARIEDRELILDVEPIQGHPGVGLVGPQLAWAPFTMCGAP